MQLEELKKLIPDTPGWKMIYGKEVLDREAIIKKLDKDKRFRDYLLKGGKK